MTFEQAKELIDSRLGHTDKHSLDVVRDVLARLGNPHFKFRAIHVAGTNGKGSVCAMFSEILKRSGLKTGLYTSPHLEEFNERICINGEKIPLETFGRLIGETLKAETTPLNFFELLTCAGFLYFAENQVDAAVVEVGMGGRLDATNVLPAPALSVITSIDIDHMQYLGAETSSIALEKAGIIKKGVPCVCGPVDAGAAAVIRYAAERAGTEVVFVENVFSPASVDWEAGTMKATDGSGETFRLGLLGRHQCVNASVVLKGISALRKQFAIPKDAVKTGLEKVRWPGRFQILRGVSVGGRHITLIFDGAHNPAAVSAFAETYAASPWCGSGAVFLLGVLKDKDYRAMLKTLSPYLNRVVTTLPPSQRALDPLLLADEIIGINPKAGVEVKSDLKAALVSASRADAVVVTGSLYLVGAIMKYLLI